MQMPAVPRREVITAVSAVAITGVLWLVGWLPALERPVADLLLRVPHPGGDVSAQLAAVLIDDRAVAELGPLPWPRSRLAEALARVRSLGATAVIVDVVLSEPGDEDGDLAFERAVTAGPTVLAAVLRPDGGWLLPLVRFGGARIAAHAHAEVAGDGVVRQVSATKQADGLSLEALAVAAARHAGWDGTVTPGELLRPDFREPPGAIRWLGAADLLGHDPPSDVLRDRVVFFGLSASGAGDQFVVPVGDRRRPAPGVLVHAAVASSLLRGGLLRSTPAWLALAAALLLAGLAQLARTRAGRLHVPSLAVLAALIAAAALGGLWLARVTVPAVSLATALAAAVGLREMVESREAQRQTGTILQSLISQEQRSTSGAMPRGVHGRLELVRRLQDQLVRDRNLRQTLLEGLQEGVVLWSADGEPLLANAALERLWGAAPSRDEVGHAAGRDPSSWGDPPPELEHGGRPLEVVVWPLDSGHLGLVRDVGARRELEQRRREMQRLVSHELKTPLASIAGFGSMLERYELSGDELRRIAGLIRGESERLGEMVRTFLDLERLGSGRWEAARETVRLDELVRTRAELLAPAAAERRQRIEVAATEAAPISGAPQLLERLIDNLVGNALKYSGEGTAVDVAVRPSEGQVLLEVRDSGEGIPEEALPHLFERFYRVPGASAAGSGLGLALVKEIADWHDATVEVASTPGRGSIFTVRFPDAVGAGDDHGQENPGR